MKLISMMLWLITALHFTPAAISLAADQPASEDHGSDWCSGHGVPESKCTICNPVLIASFKAAGDWCPQHGLPKSVCPACRETAKGAASGANAQAIPNGGACTPGAEHCDPPKASHEGHGGQGHGEGEENELSDLDRPTEELFADECEHNMKTFACAECRYEVGVVRAPEDLFKGGLLTLAAAERRKIGAPIPLTGEIQFDERWLVHLRAVAPGIIHNVSTALGHKVAKGDLLITLESAAVGEAQGAYLEARAMRELAKRALERLAPLHESGAASAKEYFQAKQEFDAAEIQSASALGSLLRLGVTAVEAEALTLESANGRVGLRAPQDGVVISLHAVPGESALSEEPLLTLGNPTALWVWADLKERDLAAVRSAQQHEALTADVMVDAYPTERFVGKLDLLSPVMEPAIRTVKSRLTVENPDGRLVGGMFAHVELYLPGDEEALAIPGSAAMEDEGRSFVFIQHHEDYYVRRPIEVGRSWGGWVEVTGGLSADQKVVAGGAFLLKSDVLRSKMGAGCAD